MTYLTVSVLTGLLFECHGILLMSTQLLEFVSVELQEVFAFAGHEKSVQVGTSQVVENRSG